MPAPTQPGLLICPACGQRLPGPQRRVCGVCGKPIRRHEKFYFEGATVRHRNCAEPKAYRPEGKA